MAPLRVAIAGLGTVGAAVADLLTSRKTLIKERCGREIVISAVSARDRLRDRGVDLTGVDWYEDAAKMASQADAEVIIELIGGEGGVAKTICENAISSGRHVVTANKALLAMHGMAFAKAAEKASVGLLYEASVAGGIPIIKSLREGFAGNKISSVHGILNGTCNYILTTMRETGREFDDVLTEAQDLGYAEADPSVDVGGIDAAHKLALLASVAFGAEVNFHAVHVEGIQFISADDIAFASELGYRIKLLGIANQTELGVEQRVHPAMVPIASPLAHVEGVFNAVVVEADAIGTSVLQGEGAGAKPTASAVVSDLIDIARNTVLPIFSVPVSELSQPNSVSLDNRLGPYYLRLIVLDRPGVIADVSAALKEEGVSVEVLLQRGRSEEGSVPVVLKLHETVEANVRRAVEQIAQLDSVVERPCMIRIEEI